MEKYYLSFVYNIFFWFSFHLFFFFFPSSVSSTLSFDYMLIFKKNIFRTHCEFFESLDRNGYPIYHTNVIMSVGTYIAVVCTEAIKQDNRLVFCSLIFNHSTFLFHDNSIHSHSVPFLFGWEYQNEAYFVIMMNFPSTPPPPFFFLCLVTNVASLVSHLIYFSPILPFFLPYAHFTTSSLSAPPLFFDSLRILDSLKSSGHSLIEISIGQMESFCANILEVRCGKNGDLGLILSERAASSFTGPEMAVLETFYKNNFIIPNLEVIETVGGGGARCMVGELFWDFLHDFQHQLFPSCLSESDNDGLSPLVLHSMSRV